MNSRQTFYHQATSESFPCFFYRHGFGNKSTDKTTVVFCLNKTYFCQGLVSITPAHKQTSVLTYFFMDSYGEIPTDNLCCCRVIYCVYQRPENSPFNSSHSFQVTTLGSLLKKIFLFSDGFEKQIHFCYRFSSMATLIQIMN